MSSSPAPVQIPVHLLACRLNGRVPRLITAGLVLWIISVIAARDLNPSAATYLPSIARYLAVEAFAVAALLSVQLWRVTTDGRPLRAAIAFGSIGIAFPVGIVIIPWSTDGVHVHFGAVLIRATLSGAVFALLRPNSGTGVHLRRVLVRGVVGVAATAVAAVLVAVALGPTIAGVALEALLAAGWTALLRARRRARAGAPLPPNDWSSLAMLAMGLDEIVRLLSVAVPGSLLGTGSGFDLTAGVLFAWAACTDLRTCRRDEPAQAAHLTRELADANAMLDHARQAQRARLHDARSALIGVAGASALLARPTGVAAMDRADLARMIAAEVTRLQALLDTDTPELIADFDLAGTLEPVLRAHGLSCPTLRACVPPVMVHGRPFATATALDSLLRNAATHAPGAAISVWTNVCPDTVEIVVDDDGPGIPRADRVRVLNPGQRGADVQTSGSGLGLHNALVAIVEQAGELTLRESPTGGARVVISLPRAAAARAVTADQAAC